MTAAQLVSAVEIPRDRWLRPLVLMADGSGKREAYTRCTTYVDCLEDHYNLEKWKMRMTALGMVERPDLVLAASAHREDKSKLNEIVEDAVEAAAASAAANIGTALHALAEQLDRGQALGTVPVDYTGDLDAYRHGTAKLNNLMIESFVVNDDLKIGGTFDRLVEFEGEHYIADIKTGGLDYAAGKIAMQLAVYAHSDLYEHATGRRSSLGPVSHERAIVVHLPAGEAVCRLYWVDIAAGWEAVSLAGSVREWRRRSRNGLFDVFDEATALGNVADVFGRVEVVAGEALTASEVVTDPIEFSILAAQSEAALTEAWSTHRELWTPAHTELAKQRKAQLSKGGTA